MNARLNENKFVAFFCDIFQSITGQGDSCGVASVLWGVMVWLPVVSDHH